MQSQILVLRYIQWASLSASFISIACTAPSVPYIPIIESPVQCNPCQNTKILPSENAKSYTHTRMHACTHTFILPEYTPWTGGASIGVSLALAVWVTHTRTHTAPHRTHPTQSNPTHWHFFCLSGKRKLLSVTTMHLCANEWFLIFLIKKFCRTRKYFSSTVKKIGTLCTFFETFVWWTLGHNNSNFPIFTRSNFIRKF